MTLFQKTVKFAATLLALLLAVGIIAGIVRAVAHTLSVLDKDETVVGDVTSHTVGKGVHSLDVEIGAADLVIRTGDAWAVETNHTRLTVEEKNGTLYIREESARWKDLKGLKLEITVPAEAAPLPSVRIETGAGRVKIGELAAEKLEMSLGAGEVTVESLTATDSADIDGGAGAITVRDGALHDLELDMGVGGLKLTSRLSGEGDLDLGVGAVELTLIGTADDYRVALDKGLGRATFNGETLADGDVVGSGPCRVELSGGVGEIRVTTK